MPTRPLALEEFLPALREFDLVALEAESATVFALDRGFRLAYVNPAWVRFALENGAPRLAEAVPLGRSILDAIDGPLRRFYERRWHEVMLSGEPWDHTYEASSPEHYRLFRARAVPVRAGGILVTNTQAIDRPHDAFRDPAGRPWLESLYADGRGAVTMCGHCRRVRRRDGKTWDWIPRLLVDARREVTHTLCPVCLDHYYPPQEDEMIEGAEEDEDSVG